jgi:hypothetical protein
MTRHDTLREGVALGLVVATATWLWIVLVDFIVRQPGHTFALLGGVGLFTLTHYLLNVLYGIVIVTAIHASHREPTVFIALVFGLVIMEIAFAMLTAILSIALGSMAWIVILGGSLIGLAVAIALLNRKYPFGAHLRRAEEQR